MSDKFGYKNFLLTHSATAALEISALLSVKKGIKRVMLPSYTFSTANAFLRSNIKVKFCDIHNKDFNIDLNQIKSIKENDALCLVHYANSSSEISQAKKLNFNVLIGDAAQSFNVKYDNKLLGTLVILDVFLSPNQNIHSGFGGLFISKSKSDLEKAKYIYERGTDRSKVVAGIKKQI